MLKKQYLKNKPVCKVTFSLPVEAVEGGKEVRVVGDFNDWTWEHGLVMALKKDQLQSTVELAAGRTYEFRYLVDNVRWVNDWNADQYLPSPYFGTDNSVLSLLDQPNAVETPVEEAPSAAPVPVKKARTTKTTSPTSTGKDDLKKIEGVGPKIETLLNARGIKTFSDLASAEVSLLMEILEAAGSRYKMHDPTTWPQQAALAASASWDALNKLQAELKGGKR